jgi:hypothetical protein
MGITAATAWLPWCLAAGQTAEIHDPIYDPTGPNGSQQVDTVRIPAEAAHGSGMKPPAIPR